MSGSPSLAELRARIDEIDRRLVAGLDERVRIASEIGAAKAREECPVFDPSREADVLERVEAFGDGSFPAAGLRRIFREVMSASLSKQKPLVIGFLGPESTFTHQAARESFGSSASFRAFRTIAGVFQAVERGSVDFGVVPVENSIQGSVFETLDAMVESDLRIVAERRMRIDHCLISRSPLADIRKVYSKDQALGQCRNWLARNLPSADLVEAASTARAVEIAATEEGAAAVAGLLAAERFGVPVLEKGIQDHRGNHTRFVVLGRPECAPEVPEGRARTALAFSLPDAPGALQSALGPFAERGINLSRIESRPSRRKAWDYLFFIEFAGNGDSPGVREALAALRAHCPFVKELGSFPVADELD